MSESPMWRDALNDVPYWLDMEQTVRAELVDGSLVTGKLLQYDQTAGPDEAPLFNLVVGSVVHNWFDDVSRWHIVPNGGAA